MAGPVREAVRWRVYYFGRPPVDNTMCEPSEIPDDCVAGVVQNDYIPLDDAQNVGRVFVWEHDWIWYNESYDPPRWEGGDTSGMHFKLRRDTKRQLTGHREGWRTSFEDWLKMREIMENDPDFLPKSAYRREELKHRRE